MVPKMNIVGFDHIISEKGNTYIALRQLTWKEDGPVKIDLRKYMTNSAGEEVIGKGVGFDEEAADELTEILCSEGFGNTHKIIEQIKDREDFQDSLRSNLDGKTLEEFQSQYSDLDFSEKEEEEEQFYDIRNEVL